MTWPVPHPVPRGVAAIALATLMLVSTVAAFGFALAQTSDPTSAPDAQGRVYAGQREVLVKPQLVWNATVDLTFTNLTEGIEAGSAVSISSPAGDIVHQRSAYAYDNTSYAVTFPEFTPGAAGRWTLHADGMANRTFFVNFTSDYKVALDRTDFNGSEGDTIAFTVYVAHAVHGYAISGAEIRIDGRFQGTTDTEGRYFYVGPMPVAGTHTVSASRDFNRDGSDDVLSWTHFTVRSEPTGPALVAIHDAGAAQGFTTGTSIVIHEARGFGALTLSMRYNASAVEVEQVLPTGYGPNLTMWWHDDEGNGTLRILFTGAGAIPGPSGTFELAHVMLKALGAPGSESRLDLTVEEAVHSNGTSMATQSRDGTFRSGLLGDADADGDVDMDDLEAIAEYVLGIPSASVDEWGADVNRDGRVSGVDAMRLEQRLLRGGGPEPSPMPPGEPAPEPAPPQEEPATEPTSPSG